MLLKSLLVSPKVELSKALAKDTNNKFGSSGSQKFNNGRVTRWNIFFFAPLHNSFRNIVIGSDHLNLCNFTVGVEES